MTLRTRLKKLELQSRNRNVRNEDCICFPPDEPPALELKAEIEAARGVLCPLHGERFRDPPPTIYRVIEVPAHLSRAGWSGHSPQYIKAMEASFPPDRFPAGRVDKPDGGVRFVLKDGTEIHRIAPPPEILDLRGDCYAIRPKT